MHEHPYKPPDIVLTACNGKLGSAVWLRFAPTYRASYCGGRAIRV